MSVTPSGFVETSLAYGDGRCTSQPLIEQEAAPAQSVLFPQGAVVAGQVFYPDPTTLGSSAVIKARAFVLGPGMRCRRGSTVTPVAGVVICCQKLHARKTLAANAVQDDGSAPGTTKLLVTPFKIDAP